MKTFTKTFAIAAFALAVIGGSLTLTATDAEAGPFGSGFLGVSEASLGSGR